MPIYLIEIVKEANWLSLSNVLAVVTAVGVLAAGLAAWFQLRTMSRQMLATTLLTLDDRWESDSLKPARDALRTLAKEVGEEIRKNRPGATAEDWLRLAGEMFPDRLQRMKEEDPATHETLLRICGFFETVGYAANAKYIAVSDVTELLGGSIRSVGEVFENHIRRLQEVKGSERLYDYCLWLFDQNWLAYEKRHSPTPCSNGARTRQLKKQPTTWLRGRIT
jgi:hypothetical protein